MLVITVIINNICILISYVTHRLKLHSEFLSLPFADNSCFYEAAVVSAACWVQIRIWPDKLCAQLLLSLS